MVVAGAHVPPGVHCLRQGFTARLVKGANSVAAASRRAWTSARTRLRRSRRRSPARARCCGTGPWAYLSGRASRRARLASRTRWPTSPARRAPARRRLSTLHAGRPGLCRGRPRTGLSACAAMRLCRKRSRRRATCGAPSCANAERARAGLHDDRRRRRLRVRGAAGGPGRADEPHLHRRRRQPGAAGGQGAAGRGRAGRPGPAAGARPLAPRAALLRMVWPRRIGVRAAHQRCARCRHVAPSA
jgi:hypothetical protein